MKPLVIDTSLVVLLVVGLASREFVERHKRLREFSRADFDLLTSLIGQYAPVVTTPNVWTEASNLARQIPAPARNRIGAVFRAMTKRIQEEYVASATVAEARDFLHLGLTDCGLLDLEPTSAPILTSDLDLYLAAQRRGRNAINFNHLRDEG